MILKDGQVLSRSKAFSRFDPSKAAEETLAEALKKAKLTQSDLDHVTATGSGMEMVLASDSTIRMRELTQEQVSTSFLRLEQ